MKPKKRTQRELILELSAELSCETERGNGHSDRITLLERAMLCHADRIDDAIENNGQAIDRVDARTSRLKSRCAALEGAHNAIADGNKSLATNLSKLDERCEHRNRVNRDLFSSLQRRLGHVELENESRRECQDVQRKRIEDLEARVQSFEAMFEAMARAFDNNI